jgi:hypothetical protein
MKDIDQDQEELKKMSRRIIQMENQYDDSMRGVFLDQVVSEYVEQKGLHAIQIYEQIVKEQLKDSDSYGDIDTSIIKLKVVGNFDSTPDPDYIFEKEGIFVRDNPSCSSETEWVIIKITKTHIEDQDYTKELADKFKEIGYYFYSVRGEKKKIDLSKLGKYKDMRDDNFITSFESRFNGQLRMQDKRGMMYRYHAFEHLYRNLLSVEYELNENKDEIRKD